MDKDKLIARREELILTVEAIDELLHSRPWQTLRELVFTPLEERLERQILAEAKRPDIETKNLYVLQGELANARRYDLPAYAERCKKELEGIKINLQ